MSQYIHEIVLQDFIIENINSLDISVKYKTAYFKIIESKFNKTGTFWDLEGKLENGQWIPLEIEWISENFFKHKHHLNSNYKKFLSESGVLLVLRKNKELPEVNQVSLLENITESKFTAKFNKWFKDKSLDYSNETLGEFLVGNYKRNIPRILVIPVSIQARSNYFCKQPLYRKNDNDPLILGFKEEGYNNNAFVRDIQDGDICLFIDSYGNRCKRKEFINNVKENKVDLYKLVAFKIKSKLHKLSIPGFSIDELYWKDEIKNNNIIYPYRCLLGDKPFFTAENTKLPFIENFTEEKWELLRSCIQYGRYYEMSSLDFTLFISELQ